MTFDKATTRTPVSIEDLSVVLTDYTENQAEEGEPEVYQTGRFEVQVKYSTGEIKLIQGDLVPHLTTAQITGLMGFMDDMRAKAESEILP